MRSVTWSKCGVTLSYRMQSIGSGICSKDSASIVSRRCEHEVIQDLVNCNFMILMDFLVSFPHNEWRWFGQLSIYGMRFGLSLPYKELQWFDEFSGLAESYLGLHFDGVLFPRKARQSLWRLLLPSNIYCREWHSGGASWHPHQSDAFPRRPLQISYWKTNIILRRESTLSRYFPATDLARLYRILAHTNECKLY